MILTSKLDTAQQKALHRLRRVACNAVYAHNPGKATRYVARFSQMIRD